MISKRIVTVGAAIAALMVSGAVFAQGAAKTAPQKPVISKPHAKITMAQANSIATKKYHGKLAGKTVLENEDGAWQYAVMVQSGKTLREVMVNAGTGKIDNVEVTTKDKEAKEAKADAAKLKGGKKEIKEEDEANEKGEKGEANEKGEKEEMEHAKAPVKPKAPIKPKHGGGH